MLSMDRKATDVTSKNVLSKRQTFQNFKKVFFTEEALQISIDASKP
jgi:hypothetical protein